MSTPQNIYSNYLSFNKTITSVISLRVNCVDNFFYKFLEKSISIICENFLKMFFVFLTFRICLFTLAPAKWGQKINAGNSCYYSGKNCISSTCIFTNIILPLNIMPVERRVVPWKETKWIKIEKLYMYSGFFYGETSWKSITWKNNIKMYFRFWVSKLKWRTSSAV